VEGRLTAGEDRSPLTPPAQTEQQPEQEVPSGDIQVIARVATMLECIDGDTTSLDVATTAKALGVGRSTAHRYLVSLEKRGFLQRRDATNYELGPLLRRLGTLAMAGLGVVDAAGPIMRELVDDIANTVVLGVWGGRGVVVARVVQDTSRFTNISIDVGRTLPEGAAQSQVFAAYRRQLSRRGRSSAGEDGGDTQQVITARQTYYDGALKAIAAPVLGIDGQIVASLACVGLSVFLPDAEDAAITERIVAAAARIGRG
jgi:DNA-binding IclR family transcriptional regulator